MTSPTDTPIKHYQPCGCDQCHPTHTPRTDAVQEAFNNDHAIGYPQGYETMSFHARQLEKELATANRLLRSAIDRYHPESPLHRAITAHLEGQP